MIRSEGHPSFFVTNRLGSSRRIIFNYEKDEANPTLDKLIKMADFFDVSLDYLVGRSEEKKKMNVEAYLI